MKNKKLIMLVMLLSCGVQAEPECQIDAVSSVSFGKYNPSQTTTSVGTLHVVCQGEDAPFTITLTQGGSVNYSLRQMKKGAAKLYYNLYLDPAHTKIWGNGLGGTAVVTGFARDCTFPKGCDFNIYGVLPDGQSPEQGQYLDPAGIVATLTLS